MSEGMWRDGRGVWRHVSGRPVSAMTQRVLEALPRGLTAARQAAARPGGLDSPARVAATVRARRVRELAAEIRAVCAGDLLGQLNAAVVGDLARQIGVVPRPAAARRVNGRRWAA